MDNNELKFKMLLFRRIYIYIYIYIYICIYIYITNMYLESYMSRVLYIPKYRANKDKDYGTCKVGIAASIKSK